MRRNNALITSFCAGILFLSASYSEAAEHGMNGKVLSQIPENLKAIVARGQSSGIALVSSPVGFLAALQIVPQ
jgi:hypothetical protein